jgi:hypothetical protein
LRTAAAPAPNLIDTVADVPGKNVKIITSGAKVVLRGPVKSAQERASIEAKARATAGVDRRRQSAGSEAVGIAWRPDNDGTRRGAYARDRLAEGYEELILSPC